LPSAYTQQQRQAQAATIKAAAFAPAAAAGRRDTLRTAADATWRPECTYGRFRVTTARCVVVLVFAKFTVFTEADHAT